MFKLPLLQPQLTGTNGLEGRGGQAHSSFAPFGGTGSRSAKDSELTAAAAVASAAAFDVRGWSRQGKEMTWDLTGSDKYKSLALHAEVKLAEALERCDRVSPVTSTSTGEERPNKLRTAVAAQLLGEFAELCGPFSQVLSTIRDELVKSVYSWYYVSERGALMFDQLPWFSVAERLEREKEVMVQERETFKEQMLEQQEAVSRIEEQLAAFKRATAAAQLEAASLRAHLEHLTVSEESARVEAKTGREELKRLRKEYLKMKDDLEAERAAHAKLQERYQGLAASSRQQLSDMTSALQAAENDAYDARRLAESRLPPEVHERVKVQLADTQLELEESKSRFKELEAINGKLAHRLDIMTPRPAWRKAGEHGVQGKRTAEMVHKVEERLGRYANELEELKGRLALATALLQPDPAPVEVQLTLVTDSSAYFLTEGAGGGGGGASASSSATAEPLGLAGSVPRCLRWQERVPLMAMSVEDTEAAVAEIWRAKQALGVTHTPGTLQSFIYYYYTPQGLAAADSIRHVYSLYNACTAHSKASPAVRTFWLVLTGQVSERAHVDQQTMVSGLSVVAHSLPDGQALDPGLTNTDAPDCMLSAADVLSALGHMFPNRPGFKLNKLKDAFGQQFKGDRLSRNALLLALQPHGLQPPPPASAARAMSRFKPAAPPRPQEALGPFVSTLLGQHIDEVQALCMEVAAQMAEVPATTPRGEDAGGSGADIAAVVDMLGAHMSKPRALQCVMCALGYGLDDGTGGPGDVVLPTGLLVDVNDLGRAVLLQCLIKPQRSYDISGTTAWCAQAFGGGAAVAAGG